MFRFRRSANDACRLGDARAVLTVADLPEPEPGPGEVRVRVAVSGVNPSDVKSRQGLRGGELPWPASSRTATASASSTGSAWVWRRPGSASGFGWNAQWKRPSGTAARYIALSASQAVTLPDGVRLAEGACLGILAQTAHRAVTIDGSVEGLVLLVAGGAGAGGITRSRSPRPKVPPSSPRSARPRRRSTPGPRVGLCDRLPAGGCAGACTRVDRRSRRRSHLEVDLAANMGLIGSCLVPGGSVVVAALGRTWHRACPCSSRASPCASTRCKSCPSRRGGAPLAASPP